MPSASYEFVGWYLYDTNGHVSTITDKLTASTLKSGNFVIAARFKYVAEGSLVISNSMASASMGRGTTYLGVTMVNGDKETVLANVNTNTEPVTVDKSYISSNSNYKIVVEIRTVPTGENQYSSYNCYVIDDADARAAEARTFAADNPTFATQQPYFNSAANPSTNKLTYTIDVKKDIYNSGVVQEIKSIEYENTMTPVTYHYEVTYWYVSRQYGKQAMTKSGDLTVGQINDGTIVNQGDLNETTRKALQKKFLADIMPHESNFNEQISWDFDTAGNVTQSVAKNAVTNTYTFTVTVGVLIKNASSNSAGTETQPESVKKRTGYFTVPYAQTDGVPTADVEGKVAKAADSTFSITTNYDEFFTVEGGGFVTAPKIIYENVGTAEETALNFQYWEIKSASSSRGDARVIGKCYFPEFNYRAWDNYSITAIYGDASVEGGNKRYYELFGESPFTSVAFIGNTRNQWTANPGTDSAPKATADLIYNDFILTFKPAGSGLFKNLTDDDKCGVVIQRLKEIELNGSGTNAKTLQEYAKDYNAADLATVRNQIITYVSGGFSSADKGGLTLMYREVDKTNVNDKNRTHYVLPMYNNPGVGEKVGNNQKYLYRAYSYMIIDGVVTVSDDPAYFYMYDIAIL